MLFDFLLTLVKIFFPFTFVDQLFICQGIGQWFVACCPQFLVLGQAWHLSLCPVVNADSLAKKKTFEKNYAPLILVTFFQ